MQDMYHKYFEDFKLDETCRSSGRQMTEADTRISIGVIGGSHPLHIDPEYCASRPDVGRPIVQGSMVLGFIDAGMYAGLTKPSYWEIPSEPCQSFILFMTRSVL